MNWSGYMRYLLGVTTCIALACYGFILILDPYQNVPFSPHFDRAPVATNQRFSYPSIARNDAFDSAIIGTSTSRLLDPRAIGTRSGGRFANLAMNSATTYEQRRMLELFLRHHPNARYIVLGIDETWCGRDSEADKYTFRAFPEWMYDEVAWNDLFYLFNDKALEDAVRMLELLNGKRSPKYRPDGYRDFTTDFPPYDESAVAARLYRGRVRDMSSLAVAPGHPRPGWDLPRLAELDTLLAMIPAEVGIALVYPPLHAQYIARRRELFSECKARVLESVEQRPRFVVLDYLFGSEITLTDANYWDPVHFTPEVAALMAVDIDAALVGQAQASNIVRVLHDSLAKNAMMGARVSTPVW